MHAPGPDDGQILTVEQVLGDAGRRQDEDIAGPRVAALGQLLEEDGQEGDERAVKNGHEKERHGERIVDLSEEKMAQEQGIAQAFDERSGHLEEGVKGHGEESRRPRSAG